MNESRRINLDYDSVDNRVDSDSVPYIETVFRPLFPACTLMEGEIAELYDCRTSEDRIESDDEDSMSIFCLLRALTPEEISELYQSDYLNTTIENAIRKVIKERTGKDCTVIILP